VSALESVVNLKRSRLVAALKILDAEGAVYRQGGSWFRSAQAWMYPTERIADVTAARRAEQETMAAFVTTDQCLMEFLRRQLDDPGAARCGRCANCAGPILATDVDVATTQRALRHLRRQPLVIDPRRIPPSGVDLGVDLRSHPFELGRALTRWGDPGLAELVRRGKYEDGRFDDELVTATVQLIDQWGPTPSPEWATFVPSTTGGEALHDFAARLAAELGLPLVAAVERVRPGQAQKTMQNSAQQARNVAGAFTVGGVGSGPVLLIDDMVDSRWTFSVIAALLRESGSGPVYPVALANTSGSGDDGQ
jgi:ATP-dependent DNA helicase RecQ